MSANNMIMLVGRTGKDPDSRVTQSGRTVTRFSLAVSRPIKDAQGQEVTDWFQVELWGRQAEQAGALVKRGALISISGTCQIEEWTDSQGGKRTSVKVAADSFQLLEAKAKQETRQTVTVAVSE